MRRTASVVTLALALFVPASAFGQVVDLDEERPAAPLDADPSAPDRAPPVPGEPTEEAVRATRLFETGQWEQAALELGRVAAGKTGDDAGNRQIAQFHLAVALYNLKLYVASFGIFSEIAYEKTHLKFSEGLLWLARLASQLPEPAGVIAVVGKYDFAMDARFSNAEQLPLVWHLDYLLGRYHYGVGNYAAALDRLDAVKPASPFYALSKFYAGLSHVQLRQGKAALDSFEATRTALGDDTANTQVEGATLLDLANLNIARTHYTLAFRQRREGDWEVSTTHMEQALAHWDAIPLASPFSSDAFYERGRAHFVLGDFGAALGDLASARSPLIAHQSSVDADAFEVEIYGSLCDQPAVATLRANLSETYQPLRDGLSAYLRDRPDEGEDELYRDLRLLTRASSTPMPGGLSRLQEDVRAELGRVLGSRGLTRELDWIDLIDAEGERLAQQSEAFRSSDVGLDALDALDLARQIAVRRAGTRARRRLSERIEELDRAFRYADTVVKFTREPAADPALFTVDRSSVTDDSGEIERWPVDGEAWADEVGSYRAVVVSKCPAR
ncbi:MAG: hypothetical protein U0414_10265 [Polyangiaceae bacterium]